MVVIARIATCSISSRATPDCKAFRVAEWTAPSWRKPTLETVHGAQARPEVKDGAASEQASAAELAEAALARRLREAGQPLLAGLVGWHRREERPKWWEFFRVGDLDDEMLVEDGSTIGGLSSTRISS